MVDCRPPAGADHSDARPSGHYAPPLPRPSVVGLHIYDMLSALQLLKCASRSPDPVPVLTLLEAPPSFGQSHGLRIPMAPQLRIERIECVPLSMPLPRTFRGSNYFMTHRCTIITRVYTSAGIVGEVYNGDEFETQGEVVKIILDEIQPLLIGKDAFNIEGCWEAMRKPSNNILRDRKLAMCAQACVDSALWDAVGKALDTPLYKLWGGYADRLPVDLHRRLLRGRQDARRFRPRDGADQAPAAMRAASSRSAAGRPKEDAERVRVARKAVGDDFVLDRRRQSGLEPCARRSTSPGWSPISTSAGSRSRFAGTTTASTWRPSRNQTGIPICAGQSEISRSGCRDLMMSGAIDVCNFDASWGGGPTEWRRVAALAACVRRRDGTSRGAADFGPSARVGPERHLPGNISSGSRSDVLSPRRQSIAAQERLLCGAVRAGLRTGTRRGHDPKISRMSRRRKHEGSGAR